MTINAQTPKYTQIDAQIAAIHARTDNYIWLIEINGQAVIIDPAESHSVQRVLEQKHLSLAAILITHHHHDHTGGVAELKRLYPDCTLYAHSQHGVVADVLVDEGSRFEVCGLDVEVWKTAGHTKSHLSYLVTIADTLRVFCGDTLFSGGCGRVFDGTMDELYHSVQRLNTLPEQTLFYPAHEYTCANLQFALSVCTPDKRHAIETALHAAQTKLQQGGISLPTKLKYERTMNVFLQSQDDAFIKHLLNQGLLTQATAKAAFATLRELKNNF